LTATNGKDALEILSAKGKPALIFLDIMMPVMDGHEFLKRLRSDKGSASIPVIVTSTVHPEEIEGATSIITKPYDLNAVLTIAREHCQPHSSAKNT
jgi:CheY-like chemotaxis protein